MARTDILINQLQTENFKLKDKVLGLQRVLGAMLILKGEVVIPYNLLLNVDSSEIIVERIPSNLTVKVSILQKSDKENKFWEGK
jgi:hypothetical protein